MQSFLQEMHSVLTRIFQVRYRTREIDLCSIVTVQRMSPYPCVD